MSLKKMLGLEHLHITDEEIMQRIVSAQRRNQEEVIFALNGKHVKVKLTGVDTAGIYFYDSWNK